MAYAAPVNFAVISTASAGANTLVAAVTGKRIRVISYALVAAGAVSVNFENGTTDITGVLPLAANSGLSFPGTESGPAFETSPGALLGLTLSGAVQVSGHLTYILV